MDKQIRYRPGRCTVSEVFVRNVFRGRRTAPVQEIPRVRSTDQWEPLPDDVAEWMGMRPYGEAREEQAAS